MTFVYPSSSKDVWVAGSVSEVVSVVLSYLDIAPAEA